MVKFIPNPDVSDRAIDWAYGRLVSTAYESGPRATRALAVQFRPEILDQMIGMAYYDINEMKAKGKPSFPYETVLNICLNLSKKRGLQ